MPQATVKIKWKPFMGEYRPLGNPTETKITSQSKLIVYVRKPPTKMEKSTGQEDKM